MFKNVNFSFPELVEDLGWSQHSLNPSGSTEINDFILFYFQSCFVWQGTVNLILIDSIFKKS